MTLHDLAQLALAYAEAHKLPPEIVLAVALHESDGGEADAGRAEESWVRRLLPLDRSELQGYVPSKGSTPTLYTEKMWRAQSWGVMQILGETARELGFKGRWLLSLAHPENSMEWGCRKLAQCFARAAKKTGSLDVQALALLYYNGGADPDYPAKVYARLPQALTLLSQIPA